MTTALPLCFRKPDRKGPRKQGENEKNGTYQFLVYGGDVFFIWTMRL
jgi:hypothetical protein